MKQFTVEVQENEAGEQILPLPQELLDEVGWKEGDTLDFIDNKDGTFTMVKLEQKVREFVLVETVSIFRQRYVVEVPGGVRDWASDTVVCDEAVEFSQKHVDECITSTRVISKDELLSMFREDNDYIRDWSDEKILETSVTRIDDEGNIVR
jgi:bifunctional DNA-binding transcriptional regulator/antitoxin component of YhaV-PrlF toxin-antitoxin module